MKWILDHYSVTNLLATTGDDMVYFDVFVKRERAEHKLICLYLPYENLVDKIKLTDPPLGRYLNRIRASFSGYGPKHSKIFDVLYDENFDFEKNLQLYIDSKDDAYFENLSELQSKNLPLMDQNVLEGKMQVLDSMVVEFREANISYVHFLDKVDEALHELTFKYYPKLFDKGAKHIAAYKERLTSTTLDFGREIDRLMHDKFNEYWEEKWTQGLK